MFLHGIRKQFIKRPIPCLFLLSLLAIHSTFAATYYWDNNGGTLGFGNASGTWAAPTPGPNPGWNTVVIGWPAPGSVTTLTTDDLRFSAALGAGTITVSGTVNTGNMTFSGGSIVLTGGTINFGASTINCAAGPNTISSVMSGGNALVKSGSNTLILSGANTFTNTMTITAGTLQLGDEGDATNTPLGTTAAGTSVTAGAVLNLAGFTLGTAEALTLNGTGSASSGALMNSGAACTYSGLVTLGSSGVSIVGGTGTIVLSNTGTISGSGFNLTLGGAQGGSVAGIIGTGAGTLTKADAGTWTLSNANTYTGLTTISAGTLKLGAAGDATNTPLGTTAAGTTVSATGACLDLAGFTLGTAEALSLTGTGVGTLGALTNSGAAKATYSGVITFAAAASIVGEGDSIIITGTPVSAATGITLGGAKGGRITTVIAGARTLTKEGAGTWELSNTNTYTSTTTINNGTLSVTGALNSGSAVTVNTGGTLAGTGTVAGTVGMGTGGTIAPGNGGTTISATFATGALTLNANSTYSVDLNGTVPTFDKVTSSGAVALDGTLTIASLTNPLPGKVYTIIAGASMSGTFTGLADLAYFYQQGKWFQIDYDYVAHTVILTDANYTWDGGSVGPGNNNWTTAENWNPDGAPALNACLDFGTVRMSPNYNYASASTFTTITFLSGVAAFTIGGTNSLTLAGSIINNSSNLQTMNMPIVVAAVRTVTATGGNILLGGIISSTGGLLKDGANTLILTAANSYSGTTTISAGTLQIGNAGTTGALSTSSAITDNATLVFNRTNTLTQGTDFVNLISGTGALTQAGSGTLILTGSNTYTGATTISAGTLQIGNAGTTGSLSTSSSITDNATLTFNRTNTVTQGTDFVNLVSGTGALTKAGSGTLILNGSNSYAGLTTISAGTIRIGATGDATNTPLGTVAAGTSVAAGAVLDLAGYTLGTTEALTLNGTGSGASGALMNSGAACTYSGLVTLGSTGVSIAGGTGTIALSNTGTISGAGFNLTLGGAQGGSVAGIIGTVAGTLTKADAGTWTLSNSNTYTGLTTISAGTLKLGAAGGGTNTPLGTTGTGTTVSATGACLDLAGFTLGTAEALSLTGTGVGSLGALTNSGATPATYSGVITFSAAASIVGEGDSIIITGTPASAATGITLGGAKGGRITTVIAGGRTLTKAGTGTWTLSGANSFTGATTISTGTLRLGGAGSGLNTPLGTTAAGTTVSATGACLDLAGYTLVRSEALSLTGTGVGGLGALTNSGATPATYSGVITFAAAASIVGEGDSIIITGTPASAATGITLGGAKGGRITTVIAGARTLTKEGTGTWELSNTNTYNSTTTINNGILRVSGVLNSGSAVTVNSGGTLAGAGTVPGTVAVSAGGIIAPGNGTTGTLNTGALTLNATSVLAYECAAPAGTSDRIAVTGNLTLAGTINITDAGGFAQGTYTIITFTGTLTNNTLTVGTTPDATKSYSISTSTANQVNLIVSGTFPRSGMGTINGGAAVDAVMYVGTTTPHNLTCLNIATGSNKWSYTSTHGGVKNPTYTWNGSNYIVIAAATDYVIALQDNGGTYTERVWSPLSLAGAGTPYISADNASFYVPYTGNLSRRNLATGAQTHFAAVNIASTADIAVSGDYVFAGTTGGEVKRFDAGDLTNVQTYTIPTTPSVDLPLLMNKFTLYVTPANGFLYAINKTGMSLKWSLDYSQAGINTGPAYKEWDEDTTYTAVGNYVYKIAGAASSATEMWTPSYYNAGSTVNSGPIWYNGTIYFGTANGYYHAIKKADGTARGGWPITTASGNASAGPWIDETNGKVIFGTTGGNLDAFALEP